MATSTCLNKTSVTTVNNTMSMLLVLIKRVIHMFIIVYLINCKLIVEKHVFPNLNLRGAKITCVVIYLSPLEK